jgi:hypothetical protein
MKKHQDSTPERANVTSHDIWQLPRGEGLSVGR